MKNLALTLRPVLVVISIISVCLFGLSLYALVHEHSWTVNTTITIFEIIVCSLLVLVSYGVIEGKAPLSAIIYPIVLVGTAAFFEFIWGSKNELLVAAMVFYFLVFRDAMRVLKPPVKQVDDLTT